MHELFDGAPTVDEYEPEKQAAQTDARLRPVPVEYVPDWHVPQTELRLKQVPVE
jgi:hypothetical protein